MLDPHILLLIKANLKQLRLPAMPTATKATSSFCCG